MDEPYPIDGKMARTIVTYLLQQDFGIEMKSITDPISDQQSQRNIYGSNIQTKKSTTKGEEK